MPLPVKPLPTNTVTVNSELVTFRSLSRSEALYIGTISDPAAREVYALSRATDSSDEEALAFLDSTPTLEAVRILTAIAEFSGLEVNPAKEAPDPKSDTSEP